MIRKHGFILTVAVSLQVVSAIAAEQSTNGRMAATLAHAAADLAEGRYPAARADFDTVIRDKESPALARSLALLGMAQAAEAGNDSTGAVRAWHQLADDASLPEAHRTTARVLILEAKLRQRHFPEPDSARHRRQLPELPEPAVVFHVANLTAAAPAAAAAPDGSETRPFASLQQARDAVRALKKSHDGTPPRGGVRVLIHGGEYPLQETLRLAAEDSGTAQSPVVYQAKPGETPVFSGGVQVAGWRPISDAGLLQKLDPAALGRVIEADLKALGVKDFGDATDLRRRPELYCGGTPQTLARWPKEGYVKTGEVLRQGSSFNYSEDRFGAWQDEPDVRLHGYWYWDWDDQHLKVTKIDAGTKILTIAPRPSYGIRKGQRYYALNVFRELSRPGEWYLDRRTGMIYWIAPEGIEPVKAATTFSVCSEPFVVLENVAHVILLGLAFQDGRGDGIHVHGGSDCLIAGCTLRRLGGDAVVVSGGQRHGIFGCAMQTLGCGGAKVGGGDAKTLSPGGHFVENCTVSDISRYKRTYTPAVLLDQGGCGNRIAHCLFERMPSSAMRIEGNDHLIELNLVRHVDEESDDQGGLDMWGNPLYRGVVIRWNRWSDIRGGTQCGAAGVRLDDMISGVAIYGNIFERCGDALFGGIQVHGGKENLIDGNLFLDCPAGISFSRWGQQRWLSAIGGFLAEAAAPPYSTRYPELLRLKADPDVNFVTRNVFSRCKTDLLRDDGVNRALLNAVTAQPIDPAVLANAKACASNPRLGRVLFPPVPIGEIGPYPHPWRAAAGPEAKTALWDLAKAKQDIHRFSTIFTAAQVRDHLSTDGGIDSAIDWCRRTAVTKVYMEVFRDGYQAKREALLHAKQRFQVAGFEVSGCVTTTNVGKPTTGWHGISCYTDKATQERLQAIFEYAAGLFDETMIDDFWFTDCQCRECDAARKARLATVGGHTYPVAGDSWEDYRCELMVRVSQGRLLATARRVNPQARLIIKYPQWYDQFHQRGYEVLRETADFDRIWVGTETRDYADKRWGGTPQYEGYFIMRWLGGIGGPKCGGGWYDPYGTTERTYLEQARQTVLGGARESLLFCYGSLLEGTGPKNIEALRRNVPELLAVAGEVRRREIAGVAAYKPANSHPENEPRVFDFVGMLGLPLVPCHEFPAQAKAAFFSIHALKDPELAGKLTAFIAAGKPVLLTDGLAKRLSGTLNLAAANVRILPIKGNPKLLLELPQAELDAMRVATLRPFGHTFRAPGRVALYLFHDGSWVIENFGDAPASVELDGGSQTVPARGWLFEWKP
jgi:hypothetical protein